MVTAPHARSNSMLVVISLSVLLISVLSGMTVTDNAMNVRIILN